VAEESATATQEALPSSTPLSDESAGELWKQAILAVSETVASSAAHAERITAAGRSAVVASFPSSHSFFRDVCERQENRQRIEQALAKVHGSPVRVSFEVHAGAAESAQPMRAPHASRRQQLAEVAERPFVRRAMELFDVPADQFRYSPPEGSAE
jgi:hypothetical protein